MQPPSDLDASRPAKPRIWPLPLVLVLALVTTTLVMGLMFALSHRSFSAFNARGLGQAVAAWARAPQNIGLILCAQGLSFTLVPLAAAALGRTRVMQRLTLGLGPLAGPRGPVLAALAAVTSVMTSFASGAVARVLTGVDMPKQLMLLDGALRTGTDQQRALIWAGIVLAAPLGEELLFRGYVQTRLIARFGAVTGIGVTALLFGLAHFDPMHSVATVIIGVTLGYVAHRSGTLWLSVIGHFAINLIGCSRLGTGSINAQPQVDDATFWLVGAAFGMAALACARWFGRACDQAIHGDRDRS